MTTNKAVSLAKSSRKNRKDKKDKKDKKNRTRRRSTRRNKINKTNSSNLSDLYTYESPVTNNGESTNSNVKNNVNVVDGLKDFLAVKNKKGKK
jgi:hypothetical protein